MINIINMYYYYNINSYIMQLGGINMIIGICGKSGSGKSSFSRKLQENIPNTVYLDMDKIGHQVLLIPEVKEKIINLFGPSILTDNEIDRKKIGNIIFNSNEAYKLYTQIIWNYMKLLIDNFININKDKTIILDAIKLNQTEYFDMCNIKILLDVPYEIRKQRATKRDNITEEAFDLREQASIDYNINDFDYVLDNNDDENVKKLVVRL